jgi:exodeoxyribonuclease V alpha subunit
MASIQGRVVSVRHKSDDFYVFTMIIDEAKPPIDARTVNVAGSLYGLLQVVIGSSIGFIGSWGEHPKFGKQFVTSGWLPYARSTRDIEKFLSECVPGFNDPKVAELLADKLGSDTFNALTRDPARVQNLVAGDDPLRARLDEGLLGWARARSFSDLSVFLQDFSVDSRTIRAIHAALDSNAISVITENPYRLVSIDGFSLALADRLAFKQGFSRSDPRRFEGAILSLLRQEAANGHLYLRRGDLPALLDSMMQGDFMESFDVEDLPKTLIDAVDRMEAQGTVKMDPKAGVYLPTLWSYERESADMLAKFITSSKLDIDLQAFTTDYERINKIELSAAQRMGIQKLVENRVLVLTGSPGTGKTTLVRAFVRLFQEKRLRYALMAPTGIAAKRLASVTGSEAYTIHRTFGYDGFKWGYNRQFKFGVDAVVADELSMVDMELFFRVLDALHPDTMLVLVGDDAQLPSVGPGNVLRELLSTESVPHVRLTQIFRQARTSEIVIAAHQVNRGEGLNLEKRPPESEFQFIHMTDESLMVDLIVQMAARLKARDANFQVLTAKYEGVVGVNNLNDRLRESLNPSVGQPEWKAGAFHVRVGDRLMVVKNNYKLSVYNGDIGKLTEISRDNLMVRIHGVGSGSVDTMVAVPRGMAPEILKLAYAVTTHRSQGSEFDTVILPVVKSQGRMLQRNLFYTAITRAKKKCWVLGDPFSVYKAIGNDKVVQRNTAFGRAIFESVQALSGVRESHGQEARDPAVTAHG